MRLLRTIRENIVDKLPTDYRLIIERAYYYYPLRHELTIMKRLCNQNKISMDIGANKGHFALFLAKYTSFVHCFEPLPVMQDFLNTRFRRTNIRIHDCALGNCEQELDLYIPSVKEQKYETRSSLIKEVSDNNVMGEKVTEIQTIKVKVKKLDSFKIDNLGFMKIDVEGYELQVLDGAKETIQHNRPNLFIEIEQRHHKHESISHIFQEIIDFGYHGYFIYNNKIKSISDFDVERMQNCISEGTINYINNFIFTNDNINY